MINEFKQSMKIDLYYSINSFIYILMKFPIIKDLITGNPYKSKVFKKIATIFCIIKSCIRKIFYRFLYFAVIYLITTFFKDIEAINSFINVYVIFALIGLFVNNKLLNASIKKYYSVILFKMNAKRYVKNSLIYGLIIDFILNVIGTFIICLILNANYMFIIILPVISMLCRVIGEAFNILYYKKYKSTLIMNNKLYFSIVLIFNGLLYLSLYFNYYFNIYVLLASILIMILLATISIYYINKVKDYKLMYKRINTKTKALTTEQAQAYSRQAIVEVKDRDKLIDNKKIKDKKGYDLFNTIFFERHKQILLRSARNYALIIGGVILFLIFFSIFNNSFNKNLNNFLMNNLAWFVIIMYFINRGAIITQAMFYNCDHAMLTFNFYRNKGVILSLFKKRLMTVIKVNLIPTIVIALGLPILLYLSGGTTNIINYLTIPIFIILLSIFFSVHYLVIYYLLQPYNKDMEMKSVSYSIVSGLTYFISYILTDFKMSTSIFALIGLVVTVGYIVIAVFLVYKKAPNTFKIK